MSESHVLSDLIGQIYDAALLPERWPDVLRQTCDFTSGTAAMLFWTDTASVRGGRQFSWNDDPHWTQLYFNQYIQYNPVIPIWSMTEVEKLLSIRDIIPWEEWVETKFYQEWMKPQGYVDNLFANLDRAEQRWATVAVTRDTKAGPVDTETRRRMSLLLPHIRRSVQIGRVFEQQINATLDFTATLDALTAGAFLVDDSLRLQHANVAGRAMLRHGLPLSQVNGTLTAGAPSTTRVLRSALITARDTLTATIVPLTDPAGASWSVQVLPLNSGIRREAARNPRAIAAVFVHRAEPGAPPPLDGVRVRFNLTAGELRVLDAVVREGGTAAELAGRLGVSEPTVKTHLQRLFAKTGARRQADLVKLVEAWRGPAA